MKTSPHQPKGAIEWMAHNPIAANLLMLLVVVAGLYSISTIRKEVFPTFPAESFVIVVPYPGSSPIEVEEGVLIKIEEAIQDIPGIDDVVSKASEGTGVVTVKIFPGENLGRILSKVKTRVDGISSFPAEAEEPLIEEILNSTRVLNLTLYGPIDNLQLKKLSDQVRDDILLIPGITQVEVSGERDYEIAIETSEQALKQYNLRFDDVVNRIRQRSRDLPGGKIRTNDQTITLRSSGQAYTGTDYEKIILISRNDGTLVHLGDVATVKDEFKEQPMFIEFNGYPAVTLNVDRLGDQNALQISEDIQTYVDKKLTTLPEGIEMEVWADRTLILKSRIALLLKSALQGSILVILALALFLRPQLAFWVVAGVPFCFLGAFALLGTPPIDHSINVISLFGFILVLGIVVDDAIVTAESAYYTLEKENDGINSIVKGVKNVSMATIFGVITTMLAFMPLLFQTEGISRFFTTAASVVILCLFFSIIETKFILPAHLRHMRVRTANDYTHPIAIAFINFQEFFAKGLLNFAEFRYTPFLNKCLRYRYISLAAFFGFLIITSQLVPSGIVRFIFFPNVPSDFISVDLEMPQSTPYTKTHEYAERIRSAGLLINERYRQETNTDIDVIANLSVVSTDDTTAKVRAALIPSTERSITSVVMAKWWRENLGKLSGVKAISFDANAGRASIPIDIRFESNNLDTLRQVAEETKLALRNYEGLFDIRDTFDTGAPEVDVQITKEGEALGLGQAELARQIRQAFFGAEVQRVQRGRHEVRVYVRFPEQERNSINQLKDMWIRLPNGSEVPFSVVGKIVEQEGISKINRINRQRVVDVQANLDKTKTEPSKILAALQSNELKDILAKYPDVNYQLTGEAEEQQENQTSLIFSSLLILILIYAALAIPLKSYMQPLIIMSVIPFGLQGAILGHLFLGKEISIISIIGIVALAGIVVNDSLVLMDYVNQKMKEGEKWREAVASAGTRRFRAVILTSLTTFVGLLPIQLEMSIQAQFLKPMAISVAFGVLFATFVTLILVPVLCFIGDDIRLAARRFFSSKNAVTKIGN